MGAVMRFIVWLGTQIGRFTARTINRVIAWARRNAKIVQRWIERGVNYGTILIWILQALGIQ